MPPQGNIENLLSACAGGSCDGKIACETLAADDETDHQDQQPTEAVTELPRIAPDSPPESFWLSKDAEIDWFDRNAFYERKESQKGNSANLNPSIHPTTSNATSQRFKKHKAAFLGLPKPQKLVTSRSRRCCKTGNTRSLFPKRSGSVGKSDPPVAEPTSPKVSCIGRVRSKRAGSRRLINRQKLARSQKETEKIAGKRRGGGFFSGFRSIFVSKNRAHGKLDGSVERASDIRNRLPEDDVDVVSNGSVSPPRTSTAAAPAAGLGVMRKFASGRKSESFI